MDNSSVTHFRVQTTSFYVNDYVVEPSQNQLVIDGDVVNVQPKVMEVLCYLSYRANQLVSAEDLIKACWDDRLINDGPVHKCIAQLRRSLNDDPKHPKFIKTVVKKGYVLIANVRGLAKQAEPMAYWDKGNPFPAAKPYSIGHEAVFFGRSVYIDNINRWLSELDEHKQAWLSVEGVANIGKTSMIQAGILPNLKHCNILLSAASEDAVVVDCNAFSSEQNMHEGLLHELQRNPQIKTLLQSSDLNMQAQHAGQKRVAVVIDHLEAALNARDKAKICQTLSSLVSANLCVLITAVDSRYTQALNQAIAEYAIAHQCVLAPPSANEFIAITRLPFIKTGMTFEFDEYRRESLDHVITHNLQLNPVPLAVLQLFLSDLYAKSASKTVLFSDYEALGGLAGYYANLVEHSFAQLSDAEQAQFNQLLFSLISLESSGELEITIVRVSRLESVYDQYMPLIDKCVELGILSESYDANERYVFLAHDYLLNAWQRITDWKQANLPSLYLIHDFQIFAHRWSSNQEQAQYLIPSRNKLNQIDGLVSAQKIFPSDAEQNFITQSAVKLRKKQTLVNAVRGVLLVCFISLLGLTYQLHSKNTELDITRSGAEDLVSFILYDLKEKLEPLGKLELLDIAAQRTLAYFNQEDAATLQGENLHRWITALHILGEVNIGKHRYEDAIHLFEETVTALENRTDLDTSEKSLELYLLANYWIGYIYFITEEYALAEPYLAKYYAIAQRLNEHFPSETWLLESSYALNNLGALAEKQRRFSDASNYFASSLMVKKQLLSETPNDSDLLHDIADTMSWQSSIYAQMGELNQAISVALEALAMVGNIEATEDNTHTARGRCKPAPYPPALRYFESGDQPNAFAHVEQAIAHRDSLKTHDVENYSYALDLVWSRLLQIKLFIPNPAIRPRA